MPRIPDKLKVEITDVNGRSLGLLDNFTSFSMTLDITQPSEASFELGDDGTFASIGRSVAPATQYRVFVNDRLQLSGRVEANDVPVDASAGAVVRFTVRTKLADAAVASADPSIRLRDSSLLDFLLAVYEPQGLVESDFHFDKPSLLRDIRTGKRTSNTGDDFKVRLNRLKLDEMRVRPPETIFGAADRYLRRFGLMHWDGPDGKIVVGFPNQTQTPSYNFATFRNSERRSANNTMGSTRAEDWSSVPSFVMVAGRGGKRRFSKAAVVGIATQDDVVEAGLHRPVYILSEGLRNEEAARNAAERELSSRVRQKDTINHEVDALSYWDGTRQTTYGNDTIATYDSDVVGGHRGNYYVHRVEMARDADSGDTTRLTMLKAGLWKLFPDVFEGRLR